MDKPRIPTRPRCQQCGKRITMDFICDNAVWIECFGEIQGPGYRCINCLAEAGDERGIDWSAGLVLIPLPLTLQRRIQAGEVTSPKHILHWYPDQRRTSAEVDAAYENAPRRHIDEVHRHG